MLKFLPRLGRAWSGRGRPHPVVRRGLRVEALEGRDVPSGNVTAVQIGTTLYLNGVNGTGDDNQRITITGVPGSPGELSVVGDFLDTTVNSGAGAVGFTGVESIIINMNNGDDVVRVDTLELAKLLSFNGGNGHDELIIGDLAGNTNILGAVTFIGGNGDDTLTIQNGYTEIAGLLNINTGPGINTVNIGVDPTDFTSIGSLTLVAGNEDDFFFVGGSDFFVNGNVSLSMGHGNNDVYFGAENSIEIVGKTTVNHGNGFDLTTFGAVGFSLVTLGPVTINNGSGGSVVTFDGFSHLIQGDLWVASGNGFDVLQSFGDSFEVTGKMTVQTGNDGSVSQFLSTGLVQVGGNVAITNGNGDDEIYFGELDSPDVNLGNTTINTGFGTGTVAFNGFNHTITGNLTVNNGTGAGVHLVEVTGDSLTVTGNLSVSNGNAVGTVTQLIPFGILSINGSATVRNNNGDDIVVVGDFGTFGSIGKHLTITNGNGQGQVVLDGAELVVGGNVLSTTGTSVAVDLFDANADLLQVGGSFTVNHGHGPSMTTITGATQGFIGKLLDIRAGLGEDTVVIGQLDLANVNIILNGGGNTNVFIDSDVTSTGLVTIRGGNEDDTVVSQAFQLAGLTIATLGGTDDVTLSGEVTGHTNVNLGNGSDLLIVENFVSGGNTTLDGYSGNDEMHVHGSIFNGNFLMLGGAGDDILTIAVQPAFSETIFNKSATVNAGLGNDDVTVGSDVDPTNFGDFNGQAVFNSGGGGVDTLFIGPPRLNSFMLPPVRLGWDFEG